MSSKYTYSITDFLNDKVASDSLTDEIASSDITVALDYIVSTPSDCDIWFKADISASEYTTLNGVVASHKGEPLPDNATQNVDLIDEYRDRSGKLRVHQTSRKLGMRIMWTGVGDDPTDPHAVGGGTPFTFGHDPTISGMGDDPNTKYIDFNCVDNETWLHEGYITWKDAALDTLTLEMVPRVTAFTPTTSGNYDLYGGYLVVPAYPGQGSINLTTDITQHDGGLVYMPDNDLGEAPTAFWNADWNTSTKEYENIAPAPYGNGRYNMFIVEVVFARFMNDIALLGSGFIAMNSSDTDQFGHGMRLKMTADTNMHGGDHAWYLGCTMCLHRESSV